MEADCEQWQAKTYFNLRAHGKEEHRKMYFHLTVLIPDGVDEARVRRELRSDYKIELGAGLGPWQARSGG
jgi:hypothetical protein